MKKLILLVLCLALFVTGCQKNIVEPEKEIDYKVSETQEILDDMSLEEKVAQLLIIARPSVDAEIYANWYQPGGYIFFYKDFQKSDPESFRKDIQTYQDNVKIPMFMAVDEEGGEVVRVSSHPQFREEAFKSPRTIYAEGGIEAIRKDAKEKSEFLLSLGLNINFGPVCDIVEDNSDAFMYSRCVGLDAEGTSKFTKAVIEEMNSASIGSVLKHFPGYGENDDTHITKAYDNRGIENFRKKDFLPFKAGMEAGANMIMVSHNIIDCIEEGVPSSLSPKVHKILREELGFEGVIITDDMSMGAIPQSNDKGTSEEDTVNPGVQAILAGNDMICLCDENFKPMFNAITEAVKKGTIPEKQIDESVKRIIEYKRTLGLFK